MKGVLRVSVDALVSRVLIGPKVDPFLAQYPALELELVVRDHRVSVEIERLIGHAVPRGRADRHALVRSLPSPPSCRVRSFHELLSTQAGYLRNGRAWRAPPPDARASAWLRPSVARPIARARITPRTAPTSCSIASSRSRRDRWARRTSRNRVTRSGSVESSIVMMRGMYQHRIRRSAISTTLVLCLAACGAPGGSSSVRSRGAPVTRAASPCASPGHADAPVVKVETPVATMTSAERVAVVPGAAAILAVDVDAIWVGLEDGGISRVSRARTGRRRSRNRTGAEYRVDIDAAEPRVPLSTASPHDERHQRGRQGGCRCPRRDEGSQLRHNRRSS